MTSDSITAEVGMAEISPGWDMVPQPADIVQNLTVAVRVRPPSEQHVGRDRIVHVLDGQVRQRLLPGPVENS